ncbi:hypothetical protein CYY_007833 [Polysphondylium violaceum]|uniref:Fatty acid 2-hydroxylase n=1 Tax=Polysphondylium violaceum TaxID=133409 RepID=A0A8J4V1V9_9MYCE|nr:hypothetical protein CYY_007833 [Polysphondylium violaceum]
MIETDSYLLSEVAKHDSAEDAWVVLDGQVFDITKFIYDHPGGGEILMEHLGKDIGQVFIDKDIHEHSVTALNMLSRYAIGTVRGYRPNAKQSTSDYIKSKKAEEKNKENKKSEPLDSSLLNLVDTSKPMVPQLKLLEGENYQKWIHSQTGLKNIIIFDNSFLELFTRWPWWYIFVLWIPVITATFTYSLMQEKSTLLYSSSIFGLGLLSWGFVEYLLHRFVFHLNTSSYWGNFFHFFIHGIHHLTPFDASRLTFPPVFSILIGIGFYKLFGSNLFTVECHKTGLPWALYGGIACGYMLYDTVHYYFHHDNLPWVPNFMKQIKTNHLNHHYKDDYTNFGVTSPIFDYIFGTYKA